MAHFRSTQAVPSTDGTSAAWRKHSVDVVDSLDSKMGFERFESGAPRIGWLVNFQPTTIDFGSEDAPNGKSAVDFYFLDDGGGYFKSTIQYDPYFYVQCNGNREDEVDEYLKRKLQSVLKTSGVVHKEDLSLPNHLLGRQTTLIKLQFHNVQDLLTARRTLMPIIDKNKKRMDEFDEPDILAQVPPHELLIDVKEHDVNYHVRVSIDLDIRVGKWYAVKPPPPHSSNQSVALEELTDRLERADPVVMAFDIETTKPPLKFPDSRTDSIMMISYMIDGRGYLITNREIVSKDIEDFEYTPKPEFRGEFTIFNEPTEKDVILRFFEHIQEEKPTVIATFNGDFFDWPFVDARAAIHGLNMYEEIGFRVDNEGEYKSTHCVHMDCFRWVKRDSYLPQGSQGLKAVTTAKLGYNPLELDPELMTPYAIQKPQILSEYSVSDAVATYYLYMKYVHPFIFSLCTIIPLRPDEVLRKGTGTLCEMLLMVQAYVRNIVLPHKHSDPPEQYYKGHLVESETYVGGHVESLEAGVFRADIPTDFRVEPDVIDELLSQLDAALKFTIVTEMKLELDQVVNYDSVKQEIQSRLLELKERPVRHEEPLIYHVDVASMYPNIMTSNRLQPDSMKSERDCAMCDFNVPGKQCDRRLPWAWRGEYYAAHRSDLLPAQEQLKKEMFRKPNGENGWRSYEELSKTEQLAELKKLVVEVSRKTKKKIRDSETVEREAIICQRENPFYVNTVRDFRDRRYDFKGKQKVWKQNLSKAETAADKEYAAKMVVLFDSLQLAHKVILNSFYGYVMRKGSRWYSMEMAGVTCLTGATIIQLARGMVERLGRPLELDTDGIWCILPKSFPGDLDFELKNGKKVQFAYPCVMLNHLVHEKFTNHQYQTLVDEKNLVWETSSDNSIFFEVDGPYKAMMLPSSLDEGKGLKKRYAVFNFDGTLAELKGFEIKRRGELQLIKTFQSQMFSQFLKGSNLKECYAAVAHVANSWLDVLDSKGSSVENVDLMNLISENKNMAKSVDEYGSQKTLSLCTARRLAEFLGKEMVKDKGLALKYIISSEPANEPVTNRAIPVQIFEAPPTKKQEFLRKWLKKPHLDNFDPRAIIDWAYYRERLSATIQKLVVIPAARQNLPNPVPRVKPPAWLSRRIATENDKMKQQTIGFAKAISRDDAKLWGDLSSISTDDMGEIEDTPGTINRTLGPHRAVVKRKANKSVTGAAEESNTFSPELAPDPDVDYASWVMYMKHVWKRQREQQAARRQLFGSTIANKRSRGIQGLLQQQTESTWHGAGGVWHILQVTATSEPGKVRAVVHVNGRLQTINIIVNRKVFVLLRQDHERPAALSNHEIAATPSDYILPSGQTSSNLVEVTMSEQRYQEELIRASGLFRSRAVEEVYEQYVDAVDRVLLKLGGYCRLDTSRPGLLGKGLDTGFELDWLVAIPPPDLDAKPASAFSSDSKASALNNSIPAFWKQLNYIFVIHNEVNGNHVITLMCSWTSDVLALEYSRRKVDNGGEWTGYLASEYATQMAVYKPDQPLFKFPEAIQVTHRNIKVKDDGSDANFWSETSKSIANLSATNMRHNVAIISSVRGSNWLTGKAKILNEIPSIGVNGVNGPGSSSTPLPSVGWQLPLAKRVVKSFLRSQYSLDSMRVMAGHTNIPVSNLPLGEDIRPAVDIAFARRLQEQRHVLWWGEARNSGSLTVSDFENNEVDSQEHEQATADSVGIYPHVCLDISVSNLVVNTLLTSSYLMAAEGGAAIADPGFVTDAFSPTAWQCLVAMTKEWWAQASEGSEAADMYVQQVAGWIASPSSQLWSPRLVHHVSTLSRKALSQFTRELRKFGTTVVHSERDGQRIVLATTKKSAPAALAFGGLVVKEAKTKPQFTYLDISVNDVWDFLVWMNCTNYGGRVLKNDKSGELENNGELEYVSKWQIAEYLPPLLQDEFNEWVDMFLAVITESKDRAINSVTGDAQGAQIRLIPNDFMQNSLVRLEKPLANRVRQLQSRYVDAVARGQQDELFGIPERAGSLSRGKLDSPILAFVKTLLAVLCAVNENTEYISLRRNLLGVLHVGDFDPAAEFSDPAAKLVVRDIVCLGCMACVDVDVCHPEQAHAKFEFKCPVCFTDLDRIFLEEKLIQKFVSTIARFQMQDLKCLKCGKVRPNDMAQYCPCSGRFKNTISKASVSSDINVYRQVGRYYNLDMLNDLISQY